MKMPHTVAETFIKPCVLEIVKTVLGCKKFATNFFARQYVIRSRIDGIGFDILDQAVSDLKASSAKI